MRAEVSRYSMTQAQSLAHALQLLADPSKDWKPFAGGTDLMVLFEAGVLSSECSYLSLWGIAELTGIVMTHESVTLGALTTYSQIRGCEYLKQNFPSLWQAAYFTGALGIQNRGTLGGNIANASPAADSPPALLTYDAEIEIRSAAGSRWLPYSYFHIGYKKTALQKGEIISRIRLPIRSEPYFDDFRKIGTRKAQAISKVCFSGALLHRESRVQNIRIAFGSVAPVPLRCHQIENLLRGQKIDSRLIEEARFLVEKEIQPIDDIRSTSNYRMKVAQNLLQDFLQKGLSHVELDRKTP